MHYCDRFVAFGYTLKSFWITIQLISIDQSNLFEFFNCNYNNWTRHFCMLSCSLILKLITLELVCIVLCIISILICEILFEAEFSCINVEIRCIIGSKFIYIFDVELLKIIGRYEFFCIVVVNLFILIIVQLLWVIILKTLFILLLDLLSVFLYEFFSFHIFLIYIIILSSFTVAYLIHWTNITFLLVNHLLLIMLHIVFVHLIRLHLFLIVGIIRSV